MAKIKNRNIQTFIYGPVPSRRLGYSLGVDILPYKTCNLDCIYCQLGKTPKKTTERKKYFSEKDILADIKQAFETAHHIDYITFSGSGEPTLNKIIGELITKIKAFTDTPVAVLTNSTLLSQEEVRQDLIKADLVVPSLDAASQEVFLQINRPHPKLELNNILSGLIDFRKQYKGKIWLEILFVKDVNDSQAHLLKLKKAIEKIRPDRIHLNTVVRPPSEITAQPISRSRLEEIQKFFGEKAEIIAEFQGRDQPPYQENIAGRILDMVKRRPVTLEDISSSLGKHRNAVLKELNYLLQENKIKTVIYKNLKYYEPV
ncbi:MAG: radical SAM protein [Candidatus Aminicenantes bacterium]|nr:radical SAM protein [Candidatus Aminicenantes bacterium]